MDSQSLEAVGQVTCRGKVMVKVFIEIQILLDSLFNC